MTLRAEAVLFDKDGTLFDFHTTWSHWAHEVLHDLAAGDAALVARLAETVDYDLAARRFRPTSPVIAGTNREAAECLASALPGRPRGGTAPRGGAPDAPRLGDACVCVPCHFSLD